MYAVIETGGKQYRVQEGDVITVEKLSAEPGEKVVLDTVLLVNDGKNINVGSPYVAGAKVETTVVENGKGEKVIIYKYKAKKDYRNKQGHRQPYTMLKVDGISGKAPAAKKTVKQDDESTEASQEQKEV